MPPIKRSGNPNWGKPLINPAFIAPSSFEMVARELGLAPHQYKDSVQLRAWAMRNCHSKYVPLDLLSHWGLQDRADR
ncbi:MAG: hypothetical protein ACXVZV_07625 [Terriglobales bacterium]